MASAVWGDHDADIYVDEKGKRWAVFCCGACKAPLPWQLLPQPAAPSPVTLTTAQKAMIEEKRQAALARKRAREEHVVSSSLAAARPVALAYPPSMSDWLLPVSGASEHDRLGPKWLARAAGLRTARALDESDRMSAPSSNAQLSVWAERPSAGRA